MNRLSVLAITLLLIVAMIGIFVGINKVDSSNESFIPGDIDQQHQRQGSQDSEENRSSSVSTSSSGENGAFPESGHFGHFHGEGETIGSDGSKKVVHECVQDSLIAQKPYEAPVFVENGRVIPFEQTVFSQQKEKEGKKTGKSGQSQGSHTRAVPGNAAYLRIKFDQSVLNNDPNRTCSYVGEYYKIGVPAGVPESNHQPACAGNTVTDCWAVCTQNDIFTAAKKAQFLDVMLVEAREWLQKSLRVIPVSGNLSLANGNCGFPGPFAIPSYAVSPGIADADILIFLTARPAIGSTVAYASDCTQFDGQGRPIVGHFNVNPSKIVVNPDKFVQHQQKAVAIHEIVHILGFISGRYNNYRDSNGNLIPSNQVTSSSTVNSHTVTKVITPKNLAWVRNYYGCPTMSGMELEDQGGAGTSLSHWEERLAYNEFMTGSIADNPVLSGMTLSFLEDMGYYYPDFTFEGIQKLKWGRNQGCGFVDQLCSTTAWPTETGYRCALPDNGKQGCSVDRESKATCSIVSYPTNTVPSYYQYFGVSTLGGAKQFADFCAHQTAYASGNCLKTGNGNSQSYLYGETFGDSSRCYMSSLLDVRAVFSTSSRPRCYEERCLAANELQVGIDGVFYQCPVNGGTTSVYGYTGSVTCPAASTACIDFAIPTSVANTLPVLTVISPNKGPTAGLETVTLTGERFDSSMKVDIGGVPCGSLQVLSSTTATCITGAKSGLTAATTVDIVLTNGTGDNLLTVSRGAYQYDPTFPKFTRIFPTGGPTRGGTPITVFGEQFAESGTTYVTLGGLQCSNTTVLDSTRIRCFSPDTNTSASSTADLAITDSTGRVLQASAAYQFDNAWPEVTNVSPNQGPSRGRGVVTIAGVRLSGSGSVTAQVGDFACTNAKYVTSSSITCTMPPSADLSKNVVTHAYIVDSTGRAAAGRFLYTYDTQYPDFSDLQPPTGPSLPQEYWEVVLSGSNFNTGVNASVTVTVGGVLCRNTTVVSATEIRCLPAPMNLTSVMSVDVEYIDTALTTAYKRAEMFLYDNEWPIVSRVFPTGGSSVGGQYVEIFGQNFLTQSAPTIKIGNRECTNAVVESTTKLSCTTPASVTFAGGMTSISVLDPAGRLAIANNAFTYQGTWPQYIIFHHCCNISESQAHCSLFSFRVRVVLVSFSLVCLGRPNFLIFFFIFENVCSILLWNPRRSFLKRVKRLRSKEATLRTFSTMTQQQMQRFRLRLDR
eukprot:TRINITY_DN911_c0_g1_i2.p1 TRINITY_DN911_c0_g1~~TRINITY_DN911_c0_g1_i2.p1  ORF type:complete len:1243 (-),score=259.87 TRINITY_DN911_c0_g1_i2:490-4152(-)